MAIFILYRSLHGADCWNPTKEVTACQACVINILARPLSGEL